MPHKNSFNKGIERIEKLFGQEQNVYDELTLSEIYEVVKHLRDDQWNWVVDAVVRTWPYKSLPNISAFEKVKKELGRGQGTRKSREDCPTCAGYGLRYFVYRRGDGFAEGTCLCSCANAEIMSAAPHMTQEEAQRLPGFKAADRPGDVPHMLEALNPQRPQEARGGKGGPGVAGKATTSSTQPKSPTSRPASSPPETLVDTASELAGKLNASDNARDENPEAEDRRKADKMISDLRKWMKDDEENG
jgi:hypothetical protein